MAIAFCLWCDASLPLDRVACSLQHHAFYIPLLSSSSSGVNRMYSCIHHFFLSSCLSSCAPFCSRCSTLLPDFSLCLLWNLRSAIPSSPACRWYRPFVATNLIKAYIIEKTYPFSPSTSLSPHFLSHIFACHHIVEVANACPYTDMSDLSSGMVKF